MDILEVPMNKNAVEVEFEDKIPKPVDDVFNAIINPQKMSQYFISRASGPIVEGETITCCNQQDNASFLSLLPNLELLRS